MVGPLALDLNYASRGDREARVSVSPSGNEALPFGHSKNQSISGTLTACLPSFLPTLLGTPMCSSCLGFVAPCFGVLESGNWRSAGRPVGRPLSERNGGCCGRGRGSGIALAAMVGAPGLWLPPAAPDRSKRAGRRAVGVRYPTEPVHRLFVLVNGHRSDRTESRCHKKPTFLPFISYVLMAHGMTAAGRGQQPAAPCPDTHINLPLAPPNGPGCSIVVEMPPIRHRRRPSVDTKTHSSQFTIAAALT